MWNRNARQSGPNEAPLGNQRRWGGGNSTSTDDNNGAPPQQQQQQQQGGYGGGRDDRNNNGGGRDGGGGGGGYGNQQGSGGYNDRSGGGGGGNGEENRGRNGYDSRPDIRDSRNSNGGGGGAGGYGGQQQGGGAQSRFDDRRSSQPQQNQQQFQPPQTSAWDSPTSNNNNNNGPPPPSNNDAPGGERKRKSRWGNEKAEVGSMATAITGQVDQKILESYAVQLRLDEIARSLRSGLVVPPEGARSPSPPPTYDSHGRRTNTREVRYRKRLEDERTRLVDRQMKSDPNFKPPTEYLMAKRANNSRPTDKVYIPVKEFPEINFFGLICGPRGNSLKNMERDSGAKISIRGKGSVKEGKGRPGAGFEDDENEELHCLVTGDTEEKVQKCVKLINSVIEIAASVPEGQNDHKRSQLRELAQLNGTLRDDENQVCQNCGGTGHRKYECPEQKNWTAGIICRTCGGAGHMARDCTQGKGNNYTSLPGSSAPGVGVDQIKAQQFDSEYASLMAELGETSSSAPVAVESTGAGVAPWNGMGDEHGAGGGGGGAKVPPWRLPQHWIHQNNHPNNEGQGNQRQRPPPHYINQNNHNNHTNQHQNQHGNQNQYGNNNNNQYGNNNNQHGNNPNNSYSGNLSGYSSFSAPPPPPPSGGQGYGGYQQQGGMQQSYQQSYPQQGQQQYQ